MKSDKLRFPASSFLRSRLTLAATVVRLMFIFDVVPPDWGKWLGSVALASMLTNPVNTFQHVGEATAMRALFAPHRFVDAYHGSQIRLPPLLLVFLESIEKFFAVVLSPARQKQIGQGLLLLIVDLCIAWTLERVAMELIDRNQSDPWEAEIEKRMPEQIRPKLAHLYGGISKSTQCLSLSDNKEDTTVSNVSSKTEKEDQGPGSSTKKNDEEKETPLFCTEDVPFLVTALYYANPVVVLASHVCGSFQNLRTLLVLSALLQSCQTSGGSMAFAAFFLSLATYVDLPSAVFLIPTILFFWKKKKRPQVLILLFVTITLCLQGLSFLIIGSKLYPSVFHSTHLMNVFGLKGLAPSLSLLWYLNMELFERFSLYFTIMIAALPFLIVFPITLRLFRYPIVLVRYHDCSCFFFWNHSYICVSFCSLESDCKIFSTFFFLVQTTIFWFLWTIFRPTATLYDLTVGLCFMRFSHRSLARMSAIVSLVCICGLGIPVVLYPVLYWMWLETNSGEANFLYFQCVAYNVFVAMLFLDFCGGSLRRDKALRLTETLGLAEGPKGSEVDKKNRKQIK